MAGGRAPGQRERVMKVLGALLLLSSVGLASCQGLFHVV
jgi:hypothetical protein